jgi:hypothetical protein
LHCRTEIFRKRLQSPSIFPRKRNQRQVSDIRAGGDTLRQERRQRTCNCPAHLERRPGAPCRKKMAVLKFRGLPNVRSDVNDVSPDINDTAVNHAQRTSSPWAKVEDAAAIKWPAVIDCHDNAPARAHVGYADASSERQSLMRSCKSGAATGVVSGDPIKCMSSSLCRLCIEGECSREYRGKDTDRVMTHANPRRLNPNAHC